MKKLWVRLIGIVLVVFVSVGFSQGVLASEAVVEGNETVVVSEDTDGMLAVAGGTVIIEGDVDGAVFAAGQTVIIEGVVNGPVFAAGNTVTVEGSVQGEVFLAGNTIRTDAASSFSRDVFIAGNEIIIGGTIGRDLFMGSSRSLLQNQVERHGYIASNNLTFSGEGQIGGNLTYQAEDEVDGLENYVEGEVNYHRAAQQREDVMPRRSTFSIVLGVLGSILSAALIWLFLRGVTANHWPNISQALIQRPIQLLFIGLGVSLLLPILIILAFISNVFSSIGFLFVLILLLFMFFGKIVTASIIGYYLIKPRIPVSNYQDLISFIIAYALLHLASFLPYVGWIITLLCIFYTVGLTFRETMIRLRSESL